MSSIRAALRNGLVLATIATFTAAGITAELGVRRTLLDDLDRTLRERAKWVESTVELGAEGIDLGFKEFELHEFEPRAGASLLEISQHDGAVLYRSPSLGGGTLAPVKLPLGSERIGFERTTDGRRVRTYRARYRSRLDPELEHPPRAPELQIALGRDMAEVESLLARLRVILVGVGLAAVLLMFAFVRLVVHRSLQPVERIAHGIGELDITRLARRLGTDGVPLELEPVVRRLNDLLGRLHASFERERTFSADIAHELRTPLSGLRASLEVELSRPREAASYRETLDGALAILLQMQALVETLLQLARLDAGLVPTEWSEVDLTELTRRSLEPQGARAAARGLELRLSLDMPAVVLSDRTLLAAAVRNVIDNAVCHARERSVVEITVATNGDHARLEVRNAAPGLAPEAVPMLFERFVRGDDSRDAAGGHFGLGLALVQRVCAALGARVDASVEPAGTFVCTLHVPRQPAVTPVPATR